MTISRFVLLGATATFVACGGGEETGDTSIDTTDDSDTTEDTDDTDDTDTTPTIDISPDGNTYAVLIRGPLFTDDLTDAAATHDAIAGGGQAGAQAMGDLAHDVLLGVEDNGFLAIDRWDNLNGMQAVYSDPAFAEAFGTLFAAQPSQEIFVHQPQWANWGDYEAGDAFDPYFFVVVRGRLAEAAPADAQAAHDAVALGGKDDAIAAGDLAHVVHTGLEDPQEFLAIDIWADPVAMGEFYSNPDIAAAFASLFDAPPDVQIYSSTDWLQW